MNSTFDPWFYRVFALLWLLLCAAPALAGADSLVCEAETQRLERQLAIPDRLLHAISLVESGRWDQDHKANLAWPWTIMAEGEGRFLPSKQAAIDEVKRLRAKGVRNIDVGCMQVNLLAHPDAFATLDEAFEPHSNVAYAARFLRELFEQSGNWGQAGAHYHSQTPELAAPYKAKLMAVWERARGSARTELQLASLSEEPRLPLGVIFQLAGPAETPPPAAMTSSVNSDAAKREAARRAADAYRQAKIEEYRQKRGSSAGG
jgi:hypothetical protein